MVKQNGSGIRSRLKKVFARGKKKTIKKKKESKKTKNTIKKEKKINKKLEKTIKINEGLVQNYSINLTDPKTSKKKLKEAAKALGKKRKGQQSNNKFTPEFIEMIKNKGITNININNNKNNKNKEYYPKLVLEGKDRNNIEKYLDEEKTDNNTFIIWKYDLDDIMNNNMMDNKNDKPKYMISMKIKKSAITGSQSNNNINIFNHNIIHKNKDTGKYSVVGLEYKKDNRRMQFKSLYDIIQFTINKKYQLLYIDYKNDNDEIGEKKYLKNNIDLSIFVNKWKNPLNNSTESVLKSINGYETFTPKEVGNIKKENIYFSIRETREPIQKERETEKEVTCKKCQDFMSMDKNKWCGEDNKKTTQENSNKKRRKREPTPPEKEMCDKCKKLMEGNKNCKKLNKNEESHYQNAVRARPTINTKETHKEQTYARLQNLEISRNMPVTKAYNSLINKNPPIYDRFPNNKKSTQSNIPYNGLSKTTKKTNNNNILNTDKYKDIVLEKKETDVESIFKKFNKNVFIIWTAENKIYNYSTKTLSRGKFGINKYIINHQKINDSENKNINFKSKSLCNIIEDNINKGYSLLVPDSNNNNKYQLLEKSSFYKNNENLKKIVTDKEKLDLTVKSINKDINTNSYKNIYNELICFNNLKSVETLLNAEGLVFSNIFRYSRNNSILFIIWKAEDNKNIYKLSMNNINDKEIFHFNIGFENNKYYLIEMNCESDNYNTFYKTHLVDKFNDLYGIIKHIMKINNNNNYKYIKCGGEGEKRVYSILNLDNIKNMFDDDFNNNAEEIYV